MSVEDFCHETCLLYQYQAQTGELPGRPDNCARHIADSLIGAAMLHETDASTDTEHAMARLLHRLSAKYVWMADICASKLEDKSPEDIAVGSVVDEIAVSTQGVAAAVESALTDQNIQQELEKIRWKS